MNQKVIVKQLEKLGFQVQAVENGKVLIEELEKNASISTYSLILMDCQMPELNGYEATGKIRQNRASPYCEIPIIALTASSTAKDREHCLNLGMNDYISKPIHIDELERILYKWLPKPALDFETVKNLASLDDGREVPIIAQLGNLFLLMTPSKLTEMEIAVQSKNFRALKNEAHQLKSISGNIGAQVFSRLCEKMELLEQHTSPSVFATEILVQIKKEFLRVKIALEKIIEKKNSVLSQKGGEIKAS